MARKVLIRCPRCNQQFAATVHNIVDARREPMLKEMLIRGRLNAAVCPNCGAGGMLNAPILYFNPDKEQALVYLPSEVGASDLERQQIIGDLTNQLLRAIPPEEKKAYVLQPKVFITFRSFMEEILKAEGLTFEEVMAQELRVTLLETLLASPEDKWDVILENNLVLLDELFLQILAGFTKEVFVSGDKELAGKLDRLQNRVIQFLEAQERKLRASVLDAMLDAKDEELEAIVSQVRPIIDYRFYQDMAERIEKQEAEGKTREAGKLRELRDKLLDITARQDAEARAALEKATRLFREIWNSKDRLKALEEKADEIDVTFLGVLSTSLEWARSQGDEVTAQALATMADKVVEIIREKAPPQIKLINKLMDASYPEETQQLLEDNSSLVNEELVELMGTLAQDLSQQGYSEAAQHLMDVRRQAEAMMA